MLNFQAFYDGQAVHPELVAGLTRGDLAALTDEMIDASLALIAGCADADVTFVPVDLEADDPYATAEAAREGWTLGHVIAHATASSEESAAVAAELARGVAYHGRSRYETPWTQMRTLADCRQRLAESRRIRLASLGMWPDAPHLDNEAQAWPDGPMVNAVGRFIIGLMHEEGHLAQIREVVRQAQAARGGQEGIS